MSLGFKVEESGHMVDDLRLRVYVKGVGPAVYGLLLMVEGLGLRI